MYESGNLSWTAINCWLRHKKMEPLHPRVLFLSSWTFCMFATIKVTDKHHVACHWSDVLCADVEAVSTCTTGPKYIHYVFHYQFCMWCLMSWCHSPFSSDHRPSIGCDRQSRRAVGGPAERSLGGPACSQRLPVSGQIPNPLQAGGQPRLEGRGQESIAIRMQICSLCLFLYNSSTVPAVSHPCAVITSDVAWLRPPLPDELIVGLVKNFH